MSLLYLPPIPNYAAYMLIMAVVIAATALYLWFRVSDKLGDVEEELIREKTRTDIWTNNFYDLQRTHSRLLTRLRESGVKVEELK